MRHKRRWRWLIAGALSAAACLGLGVPPGRQRRHRCAGVRAGRQRARRVYKEPRGHATLQRRGGEPHGRRGRRVEQLRGRPPRRDRLRRRQVYRIAALRCRRKTEMSVWTAPVTAGGRRSRNHRETDGESRRRGRHARIFGRLIGAGRHRGRREPRDRQDLRFRAVSSGSTAPTTAEDELSIGFYLDSGFGDSPHGRPGYTPRANVAPGNDIELLAEDGIVARCRPPTSASPPARSRHG